jgi:DNA polymerase III alpha subunit
MKQTYAPLPRLIERLKAMGCTAAGMVDVNSTWGHVAWFDECRKAGIRPLLGVEVAVSDDDSPITMWFLARKSPSALYHMMSQAFQQPIAGRFGAIPRLYRGDIADYLDGVQPFAGGCTDGEYLKSIGGMPRY